MIKKVKWCNYKRLGNLELDFTDENGKSFNTIILAGENGTGKTMVLKTLCDFLNLGTFYPFAYIDYNVGYKNYKLVQSDKVYARLGTRLRFLPRCSMPGPTWCWAATPIGAACDTLSDGLHDG